MATYTRGNLKERIDAGIKGKQGILVDFDGTVNDVVRSVAVDELDMRSLRRKTQIASGLFTDVNSYPLPVDIKGNRIVGLHADTSDTVVRSYVRYSLVPYEDFMERPRPGFIAIDDHDTIRKLLVSPASAGAVTRISTLDSLTSGGGTWGPFGTSTIVEVDTGTYVYSTASLKFNIGVAVGTTAGIVNSTMTPFSIANYMTSTSSIFVYFFVNNTTGLNTVSIRYGISAGNYYEITVSQTHFGTAFVTGWNLLRFDVANATLTGVVDPLDCQYVALFMNKETTKTNETNYRFDNLVFGTGSPTNMHYYSVYPWIDSVTGARTNVATRDGDILIADEDEYNLYIWKGIEQAALEVDEMQTAQMAAVKFQRLWNTYGMNYPSEAMLMTTDYQAQFYI